MSDPADVLASIDATLEGWHTWDPDVSDDAMRWTPSEPEAAPDGGDLDDWAAVAHYLTAPRGMNPLEAYQRQIEAQLADLALSGSSFTGLRVDSVFIDEDWRTRATATSAYLRDVVAPAVREASDQIGAILKPRLEAGCRAFAELRPIVEQYVPALERPTSTDPRERALQAVRSRSTGPAAPRLDGRGR